MLNTKKNRRNLKSEKITSECRIKPTLHFSQKNTVLLVHRILAFVWSFFIPEEKKNFFEKGTCFWIISAGNSFRRVKIEWYKHIYLYSGRPTYFFDLHPQGTFSDHLSELDDFPQKLMILKIEQKILLRATKNLKIFSGWSLGSQVYPTILVWCCYLLFGIYGGPYMKNGRFLSFFNSAGVLVQP